MRRISENTVIGDGRVKDGSLRRRRGGRRKEKGMIRRMWNIGSIEDSSDVADPAPEPVARVCESDLGAIESDPSELALRSLFVLKKQFESWFVWKLGYRVRSAVFKRTKLI